MKVSINIIFSLFILFIFSACGSKKGTTIKGTISDGGNLTVFIDKMELQANEVIDKTDASGKGSFSINFPEGLSKGIYRVRAGAKSAHFILNGNEKEIELEGSLEEFSSSTFSVSGSASTKNYLNAIDKLRETDYSSEEAKEIIVSQEPLVALLLGLKSLPLSPEYGEIHSQIANYITSNDSEFEMADQYKKAALSLEAQHKRMIASQKVRVGQPAPDIALSDPNGNIRKLSDLKGKVVLLDFWASWCGPCRRENPNVVQTYKKYKNKGFTVYSVSLDGVDSRTAQRMGDENRVERYLESSKKRWLDAIEKDNLLWKDHVSDLRKWDSAAAAEYGVRSIPKTFLIDRDGTIAALNPRRNLEEQLLKIL